MKSKDQQLLEEAYQTVYENKANAFFARQFARQLRNMAAALESSPKSKQAMEILTSIEKQVGEAKAHFSGAAPVQAAGGDENNVTADYSTADDDNNYSSNLSSTDDYSTADDDDNYSSNLSSTVNGPGAEYQDLSRHYHRGNGDEDVVITGGKVRAEDPTTGKLKKLKKKQR